MSLKYFLNLKVLLDDRRRICRLRLILKHLRLEELILFLLVFELTAKIFLIFLNKFFDG